MPPIVTAATVFTLSLLGLTLHRHHLVSALLCLEGLLLSVFTALATNSHVLNTTNTALSPIATLALAACEAATGLALLVAATRTHASDNLKNLNLLKC